MQLNAIRVLADRLGNDVDRLALALGRARLVWLDSSTRNQGPDRTRRDES
jgi:hypothetical protein